MQSELAQAVFELMLSLPRVEESRAHGAPVFKVAGKTFAYRVVNHHDDGRVTLELAGIFSCQWLDRAGCSGSGCLAGN